MINEVLTYYANQLENYLENVFHQPEGIVKLSYINEADKGEILNKFVVTLISIERETAVGSGGKSVKNASGGYNKGFPPVNLNMNVMFAAVYDVKRYADSLSVLSAVVLFIQANPYFTVRGKRRYMVEIISLSAEELNNVWACMGGHYYPSVICKIKGLVFDAGEIRGTSGQAGKPEAHTGKKD